MAQAAFQSNSGNTTFHVLADNSTISSLITSITANCSSLLSTTNTSTSPIPYDPSSPSAPQPEQAVQYYRASSIVLTLDGYNDTTALQENATSPDVPLPTWTNSSLLNCLNQTIGAAAPLIDTNEAVPTSGSQASFAMRTSTSGSSMVGTVGLLFLALNIVMNQF